MKSGTPVPVEEYLSTSYRPDREYIEGILLERQSGEKDHSRVQGLLIGLLVQLESESGIVVFPEQRVQVKRDCFRVPDVCVVAGPSPDEQIFTSPPFLCVEILSKDDRMSEVQERIDDYLSFGVSYVWVLDPRTRRAFSYASDGSRETKDGMLATERPSVVVDTSAIFRAL